MTITLAVLYVLAMVAEFGGVVLIIMDMQADRRDLQTILEKQAEVKGRTEVELEGGSIGGQFGALMAQQSGRNDALDEFVLGRLQSGFERRQRGVGLLLAGIVLGAAGNLLSLAA